MLDESNFAPGSESYLPSFWYWLKPFSIQSPSVDEPSLPFEFERSTSPKAPGAPVLPSGSVVSDWKHGQPGPERSGCALLTTIGATPRACCGTPARAVAVACTVTPAIEKTREKNPGLLRFARTLIVSLGS